MRHREPVEPQLAALIDVLAILIIFMVAGQAMGNSSVNLFKDLVPPQSVSPESMVTAPQVTIAASDVHLSFSKETFPLEIFSDAADPQLAHFKDLVASFVKANRGKENAGIINLVTDHMMTYDHIYDVISNLRLAGMSSILFVSLRRAGAHAH